MANDIIQTNTYPKEAFIKIKYTKGISAKDFAQYIKSLDREYACFLKQNNLEKQLQPDLEITKIEKGSLDIFLSTVFCPGMLPILSNINIIFDFLSHIRDNVKLLAEGKAETLSSQQLRNYEGMNNLTTNGSTVINYIDNRQGTLNLMGLPVDFNASNSIKNTLNEVLKKEDTPLLQNSLTAVPFYWDSAKFSNSKKLNFKGICEKVSKKALNVIFSSDEIKKYMTEESHDGKPWQDLCYVVDMETESVLDKTVLKITKVYKDQTFSKND